MGGKFDVFYLLKIVVLMLYGFMFIIKEIRIICFYILKRKKEGKGKLGVEVSGEEFWKDVL